MTVGAELRAVLPEPPPDLADALSSPATAVALANQPTPTPDFAGCPLPDAAVDLPEKPGAVDESHEQIRLYLARGGLVTRLQDALGTQWNALGEAGYVRQDADLTGEGSPEVVLAYMAPGDVGSLLVLGCADGTYALHHVATADGSAPPQVVALADLNADGRADLALASRRCDAADTCQYDLRILTWDGQIGRFTNLIDSELLSFDLPALRDVDNDRVQELVIEMNSSGTSATGPLRTGLHIYDWNGAIYTLSIIQLDPPRYRIQVLHEADRAFARRSMDDAAALYELALAGDDLRSWFSDSTEALDSYALYRLLLVYLYLDDERWLDVFTRMNGRFLSAAVGAASDDVLASLPVYVEMAYVFINSLEQGRSLRTACNEVLEVAEERPAALTQLNRYGSRSPRYEAIDLCPF